MNLVKLRKSRRVVYSDGIHTFFRWGVDTLQWYYRKPGYRSFGPFSTLELAKEHADKPKFGIVGKVK